MWLKNAEIAAMQSGSQKAPLLPRRIEFVAAESTAKELDPPPWYIYEREKVLELCKRGWGQPRRIGAGLINAGNTCYLNATLQVLTYTAPLNTYLSSLDCEHNGAGNSSGFCALLRFF